MPKSLDSQVSFTAGELSPLLDARVDQAKYKAGLRQLRNMIALKQGPMTRRAGTQFIAAAKLPAISGGFQYGVRLMKFIFSPNTTFVLEFGEQYIRFYAAGQQVVVTSAANWVSNSTYVLGNYSTSLIAPFSIYYCKASISGSTTDPSLNPAHWVQQTIYEVPSPYQATAALGTPIWQSDVWQIIPCQINDVIYLVHPDYPPYKLTRFGNTDWVLQEVNFIVPAQLDQNATDTTIACSAPTGNGITLTASAPAWSTARLYQIGNSVLEGGVIYNCVVGHTSGTFATDLANGLWVVSTIFTGEMVGGTWEIGNLRAQALLNVVGTTAAGFSAGTTGPLLIQGGYNLATYGVWCATIEVQASADNGVTWQTQFSVVGDGSINVDIPATTSEPLLFQIVITNVSDPATPGANNPSAVLTADNATVYGLVQLTAVANAYSATGNVITPLCIAPPWVSGGPYNVGDEVSDGGINYKCIVQNSSTTAPHSNPTDFTADGYPTIYWSEGAWSNYRGFPQAVASYQQRVIYAASGFEPQRIWGSVTNDIENFDLGDQTLATDSFAFDLNAPMRGPIEWLIAQTDLLCGFSGAEWVINSGSTSNTGVSSGAAITPTNINAVEHSSFGSAEGIQPYIVGDGAVYCQRQAQAIRQMLFSVYTQKYMGTDLTTLSSHLFSQGVVQIDYQPQYHSQGILWCVTQQGTLCGMSYELEQDIFAWHTHNTGLPATNQGAYTDSGFESIAVIDGVGQEDDEVWVVVGRTLVDGGLVRYVERINPFNWEIATINNPFPPSPNLSDAFYVDAGITINSPGSNVIGGGGELNYLAGRTVTGLADGINIGVIPLTFNGTNWIATINNVGPSGPTVLQIGLPISYAGQPMRIDADPRAGNTQGLYKQFSDLFIRVYNSCGGLISNGFDTNNAAQPVPINYPNLANPTQQPPLVTVPTDIRVQPQLMPTPGTDPVIIVEGSDPLPLTVLALICKYSIESSP